MVFEAFSEEVRQAVKERGFEPTEVQKLAVPLVLKGEDVLVISETGTGKTEAALLPLFSKMMKSKTHGVELLYITPLRALNRDLIERIKWWSEKLGFSAGVRHGDTSQYERSKQLKNPPRVLITTPESLALMLSAPKMRKNLDTVKYVVIDEVHELVESKRGVQLALCLERLYEKTRFQRIGLSATVGDPSLVADFFKFKKIVKAVPFKKPVIEVELVEPDDEAFKLADVLSVSPDTAAKLKRMIELIEKNDNVLVFVNTRSTAEALSSRFEALKKKVTVHHSSLSRSVRESVEKAFKERRLKAVVATSSLELGIDIGSVSLVIQYSSPRQVIRLMQRVGRSGHKVSEVPRGVIIAGDSEDALEAGVIVKLLESGVLEKPKVFEKPLDVLAHQLAGIALEGRTRISKAFELVTRAWPYRNLGFEEFLSVLNQLADERIIWVDEGFFGKKQKTRLYYFLGVSMIPDEQKFFVKDIESNTNIAVLDEPFVVNNLRIGGVFITKARPWRVVDITEREVLVEPAYSLEGAIPSWEGEQIPVSFEVAQEVGKARLSELRRFLNAKACSEVKAFLGLKKGSDNEIVIEPYEDFVVMHAFFGSTVNYTLGSVISSIISASTGSTVGFKAEPYRIIFQASSEISPRKIAQVLKDLKPYEVKSILEKTISRSHAFKYKFLQVAKRFGLIERNRDYQKVSVRRLIEAVINSPVYLETINELFTKDFEVKKTAELISKIRKGRIRIKVNSKASKFTEIAVLKLTSFTEVIQSQRPEDEIVSLMQKTTENKTVKLYCTYCHSVFYSRIKDLPEKIKCPSCGSPMVAYLKHGKEFKTLFEKKKLSRQEQKLKDEIEKSAALISAYGKRAVIVLSGRGIGPDTAARILAMRRRNLKDVFKDMLEAQKNFLKTKRYWK